LYRPYLLTPYRLLKLLPVHTSFIRSFPDGNADNTAPDDYFLKPRHACSFAGYTVNLPDALVQ
jgi:hypothetical protein